MKRAAVPGWVLLAMLAASPASARLLLEDTGVQVEGPDEMRCGAPVDVRITSDAPDLFTAGSPRLQALLDATRAMLGFECRDIPEIRVTGRLRGLTQASYEGAASASTRWLLQASRAVRAAPPAAPSTARAPSWGPPATAATAVAPSAASRYSIRDLTTGMTVDAAREQARRSFDTAPSYDSRRRELSVVKGGCDVQPGSRPKSGWVCMRTLFTDGADPRAYRLSYVVTVDGDQSASIADQLRERFGPPAMDEERRGESWLRGGEPERRLGWGGEAAGSDGQPRRELEAQIRVEGTTTVLVLDLLDAGLTGQAPRAPVRF